MAKKILVIVAMLFVVLLASFSIASYGLAWLSGAVVLTIAGILPIVPRLLGS